MEHLLFILDTCLGFFSINRYVRCYFVNKVLFIDAELRDLYFSNPSLGVYQFQLRLVLVKNCNRNWLESRGKQLRLHAWNLMNSCMSYEVFWSLKKSFEVSRQFWSLMKSYEVFCRAGQVGRFSSESEVQSTKRFSKSSEVKLGVVKNFPQWSQVKFRVLKNFPKSSQVKSGYSKIFQVKSNQVWLDWDLRHFWLDLPSSVDIVEELDK